MHGKYKWRRILLIGKDKKGHLIYKSNYSKEIANAKKLSNLKEELKKLKNKRIVLHINGKKIITLIDDYGIQKTRYGTTKGNKIESKICLEVKTELAFDLYSIITNSHYIYSNDEISNTSNVQPKNNAHRNVNKWYSFKNTINYYGEIYNVIITIREIEEKYCIYSIFFMKNKK